MQTDVKDAAFEVASDPLNSFISDAKFPLCGDNSINGQCLMGLEEAGSPLSSIALLDFRGNTCGLVRADWLLTDIPVNVKDNRPFRLGADGAAIKEDQSILNLTKLSPAPTLP